MPLKKLEIANFRNLEQVDIEPAAGINLLYGDNASGKTSILEAISVLSSLRSFRCANINELVRHQCSGFRLTAKVDEKDGRETMLGIQREQSLFTIKANGSKVTKTSELSVKVPVQVIHPDSHFLINGGPKQRRRFLDWGVFHVEPRFLPAWRRYERSLKQRNAALRSGLGWKAASAWDYAMAEAAEVVHQYRQDYIVSLQHLLPEFAQHIVGTTKVEVEYRSGWDNSLPLQDALHATRQRDLQRGFTCTGPHRAELVFKVDGKHADNYVSRGQQKMLVFALLLSQVQLFTNIMQQHCVILLDDLAAELDLCHQQRVLQSFQQLFAQVFITAIDRSVIPLDEYQQAKVFHVEHGCIQEVV